MVVLNKIKLDYIDNNSHRQYFLIRYIDEENINSSLKSAIIDEEVIVTITIFDTDGNNIFIKNDRDKNLISNKIKSYKDYNMLPNILPSENNMIIDFLNTHK